MANAARGRQAGLRADDRPHRAGDLAPRRDPTAPQRAFNTFRPLYNGERPHETLGGRPPGALYRTSSRLYRTGLGRRRDLVHLLR